MIMGSRFCTIRRNIARTRDLIIDGTAAAGSGHPGGSLSMAEILGCLFYKHMRYDANNPHWEDRDRLILSKGHASPGLYSNLAVSGFIDAQEITTLRSLGSRLQGHPDLKCPGVEFCGGSLGTGLSYSLGISLAMRLDGRASRVFVIIGDGECDEGQIWEATMSASKFGLDNLTVILDRNYVQQDSYTENVMPLDTISSDKMVSARTDTDSWRTGHKWRAFGWNVIEVDGHRIEQVDRALSQAAEHRGAPTIIIARTVKGRGVEHMEDNPQWHGKAPSKDLVPIIHAELRSQTALAPSIIAGDMTRLDREVSRCDTAGADYIHLDVMDGVFVPNHTFDHTKVRELRALTHIPFDTHLMITDPAHQVSKYAEAGSDIITVHAEACTPSEFGEIHDYLKSNDVGAGIAINPGTDVPSWITPFIPTLDQVIVMSVVPGKSGQKYMPEAHKKTQNISALLQEGGFGGVIEADGGVNMENIGQCFNDGCRAFVGGSSMVGQADMAEAMGDMRLALRDARRRHLIQEAYSRGGSPLVTQWAQLHTINSTFETILDMAKEAGLA